MAVASDLPAARPGGHRRLRVGLAGLGRIGRMHARNLARRCQSVDLIAVFDPEPTAGQVALELSARSVGSFEEMLDSSVDAVVIATPTGTHSELIQQAARAGKAIFSEKPISLDRESTLETLHAVHDANVFFQVGFHRRFDPDSRAVADLARSGELGEIYLFRTSLRDMVPPDPQFLGGSGGFFRDVTIHDLDTARWMVGEIVEVSAIGAALSDPGFADIGDVDTAVVTLRFACGALGVIDNSRAAGYGYECSTEVMGRKATARIDNPPPRHYQLLTPGFRAAPVAADFRQRFLEAYVQEMESFGRSVLEGRPTPVSGEDALAAFDLASAADTAWRTGRPVALAPRQVDGTVRYEVGDA